MARLAGVSTATVSAVLNELDIVKPRTRSKVLDAIRALNYHPNLQARSLARGRSSMLGIIVSDIRNLFFAEIAQTVQGQALARGYQVFIATTEFSPERLRAAAQQMIAMRIDGLVVMTSETDKTALETIHARHIPVVLYDIGTVDERTANLRVDYERGMWLAVECLAKLGHKDLLFVEGAPSADRRNFLSHRLRSKAFSKAIRRFPGLKANRIACPGPEIGAARSGLLEAFSRFTFTGVIANADPIALGLCRALRDLGKRVPEDISLVGFDNNPFCEYMDPPLTTIDVSRLTMSSLALDALFGMVEEHQAGREIPIPVKLIMRKSAGPAPHIRRSRS